MLIKVKIWYCYFYFYYFYCLSTTLFFIHVRNLTSNITKRQYYIFLVNYQDNKRHSCKLTNKQT